MHQPPPTFSDRRASRADWRTAEQASPKVRYRPIAARIVRSASNTLEARG